MCGEIVLQFNDLDDVKLFKYDNASPFQFYIPAEEFYYKTNGKKPADYMPIVFWNKTMKTLEVTTLLTEEEGSRVSLLKTWKENK